MKGEWIVRPQAGTAVIFVHGVLSSGEACWRHENGAYWPQLLKTDVELPGLGVYVFTYQTGVFNGTYSLSDAVDALKEHMRLDDVFDCKRMIFVCHSMGGIVVRKFLVERDRDLIDRKVEVGLFLVASPSLGSSYANWISPLAIFMGHAQAEALRFSQDNFWLNDLDKEFMNLRDSGTLRIKGKELIEDKFITLKGWFHTQVVERFSGFRYFGEPLKVPLSDHVSIAKPENDRAIQHRILCEFIQGMLPIPIDLTGSWRLRDDQTIYPARLEQTGEQVTGEYILPGGTGTIVGHVKDDSLICSWDQPFNKRAGHAKLEISADRQKIEGQWNYDPTKYNSRLGGSGRWIFEKITTGGPP